MSAAANARFLTLLQREFREYRTSLFYTPLVTALVLGILMLASVLLANRFSVIGDTVLEALLVDAPGPVNISISVNEAGDDEITIVRTEELQADLDSPAADVDTDYRVIVEDSSAAEPWNFSREWTFNPEPPGTIDADAEAADEDLSGRELNAILSVVHGILVLLLFVTTANYLLGSLYDDRKDRSILFWRSMPVSELEVVLSKFVTAVLVAPLIYIAISLLLQLTYVLFMMLLVWRMDQDPFTVVVGNIDFVALMLDPLSGWLMTMLLVSPAYAWLLLASAGAKRSPFMLAVAPVVAIAALEGIFLGSGFVWRAVERHLPHLGDGSAVGFYLFGTSWTSLDLASVGGGLLFAAVALVAAVWLRKHRWEIV